jgi:hypothetical protein
MISFLDLLLENQREQITNKLQKDFVQVNDKEKSLSMDPNKMSEMDPNKMSEKEFKALTQVDPSKDGSYLRWLVMRYIRMNRNERQRWFQDGHDEQVKNLLTFFDNNKKKPKVVALDPNSFYKDINQYKSFEDFEYKLGSVEDKLTKGEKDAGESQDSIPPQVRGALIDPIKLLGKTPSGYYVYKVPQSCSEDNDCYKKYLTLTDCSTKTTWCTRNVPNFDKYLKDGPMYLFTKLDGEDQYQLNYESNQLKTAKNVNMEDEKLKNEFLQFVLDKEGRLPSSIFSYNIDLSKYKKGEMDGFPIYQIGPLYYIDAKTGNEQNNKLVYFDSETSQLKNSDGKAASTKNALRDPYNKLIMYLYKNGLFTPEKGSKAYGDWMAIRIFGNIDVPPTAAPKINGNINLSGTSITSLPNNLTINGDLDLSNTKLERLPDNLKVAGILNLKGTGLTAKPGIAAKVIQD